MLLLCIYPLKFYLATFYLVEMRDSSSYLGCTYYRFNIVLVYTYRTLANRQEQIKVSLLI